MTSVSVNRIQHMVTTARQISVRMRQRAQQTRRKLEGFVAGEAVHKGVRSIMGIRHGVYLVPTIPALAFFNSKTDDVTPNKDSYIINEADKLYEDLKTEELYTLLKPFSDSPNADLVWRLARAASDKAKVTEDKELKKLLMFDALRYAEQALKLDSSNFVCHKWYAILLHYVGEFQTTKQSIINSYLIRDHFKKAIELNPTDATSIYSLGNWCYVVADLPWYQIKIASVVFATPPSSSFEEALSFFEQAEKVDPNFYSMNHLMIGKCFLKLKQHKLANVYLIKAFQNTGKTVDDQTARKEAAEFLKRVLQAAL